MRVIDPLRQFESLSRKQFPLTAGFLPDRQHTDYYVQGRAVWFGALEGRDIPHGGVVTGQTDGLVGIVYFRKLRRAGHDILYAEGFIFYGSGGMPID